MNKYIFPIIKWKIKPWLKYYILKSSGEQGTLSGIIEGTSPLTLTNSIRKKFHIFNVGGNTKQATAILPEEYQQVDYIESSGTQYINTGVTNDGYKSETLIAWTAISNIRQIMGSENVGFFGIQNGYYEIFQTSNYRAEINRWDKVIFQVEKDSSKSYRSLIVNNNLLFNRQESSTMPSKLIYIFATSPSLLNISCYCKLKYQKIWDAEGNLVRDFIPCYRKSDNVVGLYDLVNKVFYTNAGTGAFTYGTAVTIPSPSYPQSVENVSGEVEVKVENKNLCTRVQRQDTSNLRFYIDNKFIEKTFTIAFTPNVNLSVNSLYLLLDGTSVGRIAQITATANNRVIQTITLSDTVFNSLKNAQQAYFLLYKDNAGFTLPTDAQIENGSATSYEPHEEQTATIHLPEGMEMCKIGDYKDTFVEQSGKWYKNKVVLEGVINFRGTYYDRGTTQRYAWFSKPSNSIDYNNYNTNLIGNVGNLRGDGNTILYAVVFNPNDYTDDEIVEKCNGTPYWYVLKTPVLEEITDPTLISDLNNLKNLYSYKGTTHISSSNNPSPVFEVQYYMEEGA